MLIYMITLLLELPHQVTQERVDSQELVRKDLVEKVVSQVPKVHREDIQVLRLQAVVTQEVRPQERAKKADSLALVDIQVLRLQERVQKVGTLAREVLQQDIQVVRRQEQVTQVPRDPVQLPADPQLATQVPREVLRLGTQAVRPQERAQAVDTQAPKVDIHPREVPKDHLQVPQATQAVDQVRHSPDPNREPNRQPESTCPRLTVRELERRPMVSPLRTKWSLYKMS